MATILRSSKYIRCLNGFARRFVAGHDKREFVVKSLEIQAQCINSYLTKSYATISATQRKEGVPNYENIFNALDFKVQRYGRVFYHEVEDVLTKIRDTGFIPSRDALLLIRCCGDLLVDTVPEKRSQLAQEIWSTLNMLKIPIDISHFNALLRVNLENDYDFSPIAFLTSLKQKGIEPNRVTYQRLILHYCKRGDIEGATKILEYMKETGIPLNESVFNALITGHSEANDMESAKNILNLMKEVDIQPGTSTYSALLRAYAKRGDLEAIRNCVNEIGAKDISLQDKDYFDIIHVFAANGYDNEVNEILTMLPNGPSYNVEAVYAILKVLDVGNADVALKILATMKSRRNAAIEEDESESSSGTFLIRKLVNSKYPAEKVIKACAELEKQGVHTRAFNMAVERALENSDVELSVELLKAWKEHGGTLREHYFWPLIVARGKSSNYQGIYDILQHMVKDCKVIPSFETMRDYVLPYTVGKWDETVATMKEFHMSHDTIVSAIANRMLMDKKIRKTAMFMTSYPIDYIAEPFYRPLAEALSITGDAKSFVVILRFLYDTAVRFYEEHGDSKLPSPETVVDTALRMMLDFVVIRKAPYIEDVLSHMVEAGISITPELGDTIREYFKEYATTETYAKIDKLTSGTLLLTPVSDFNTYDASNGDQVPYSMDANAPGKMFAVKRRQLAFNLRTGNLATIKSIIDDMQSLEFNFSAAVCAQIIDVACTAKDVAMADKWINKLREDHPDDVLDLQKSTKYASLLITSDRFDDALQFILEHSRKDNPENHPLMLKRLVKNLLDTAAETGNVEKTNQLFDALVANNYVSVDNFILGPLVKVHLNRNDFEGALEAFQKACINHECTPLKNELSKKFIDAEDANSLQRLTDLSTQIHGESNSLVDLVLSFLECGRARQARKILETPGLKLRSKKLRSCVERYVADDKIECLEQFIELTKNLQIVDRQEFFDIFLEAYDKKNDWQRGLNLWTEMQDEDVQPNETFLTTLAYLLIRNKKPVPFIYRKEQITERIQPEANYRKDFTRALEEGDLEEAERMLSTVHRTDPDLSTVTSQLVEEYVKQNDLDKAVKLLDVLMLKYMRQPRASSLKSVWNALIETKQFDKLRTHSNSLSTTVKKNLRFQKYLSRATLMEHGVEKCLEDLESKLTNSRKDNMHHILNNLHFTTYMQAFKENPNAVEKFKPLAEKLSEQQIYLPINMMWSYYFETNRPEAEAIWDKYLSNSHWIVFNYLVDLSKKNKNIDLLERLNDKMWSSQVITENAKMTVLSSLVDMYTANKQYDEAVAVLKSNPALNIGRFHKNHAGTLQDLKDGLESSGKIFPFQLQNTRQQTATDSNEPRNMSAVE